MHSQAALTIREWQRQDLLVDAEHARRLTHLAPAKPGKTSRLYHQIVALRAWLHQGIAPRLPTPRPAPQVITQ